MQRLGGPWAAGLQVPGSSTEARLARSPSLGAWLRGWHGRRLCLAELLPLEGLSSHRGPLSLLTLIHGLESGGGCKGSDPSPQGTQDELSLQEAPASAQISQERTEQWLCRRWCLAAASSLQPAPGGPGVERPTDSSLRS